MKAIGTHSASCESVGSKSAGITPTTVVGRESSVIVLPTMAASPPKLRRQSPSPRTTTLSLPGWSSSSLNTRPSCGFTPYVGKSSR